MQEMQVQSLGQENPLEEDMVAHSSILAWKNPMDRGDGRATVHGVTNSPTRLSDSANCLLNFATNLSDSYLQLYFRGEDHVSPELINVGKFQYFLKFIIPSLELTFILLHEN